MHIQGTMITSNPGKQSLFFYISILYSLLYDVYLENTLPSPLKVIGCVLTFWGIYSITLKK